jgi:hypothetical protein
MKRIATMILTAAAVAMMGTGAAFAADASGTAPMKPAAKAPMTPKKSTMKHKAAARRHMRAARRHARRAAAAHAHKGMMKPATKPMASASPAMKK